jgi:hypothetical protein
MQGHGENAIAKFMRERFDIGRSRTRTIVARVFEDWSKVDQETRKHERSAQLRRLKKYIRECDGRPTPDGKSWIEKPNHQARAKYEELLAKIAGTNAPIELSVNVQVSDALAGVLNNLDEDSVQAMLDEYYETKALAERAKQLLGPNALETNEAAAE